MTNRFLTLCALPVVWLLVGEVHAQNTVDPASYASPSGRYTIDCTPNDSEGIGASVVTCTRDGELVWEADLDFSFWEAAVTDTGIVAGYSYQWGRQGWSPASLRSEESLLWIVVLDENGAVRAKDSRERRQPGVMSNPPAPYEPLAQGVTLIPEEDLFIVRVDQGWDRKLVPWWTYRLSTGERVADLVPDQPPERERGFHKEIFARVIPGTPLVFVHWCVYSWADRRQSVGASLSVLNGRGEAVWSEDISGEYDGLGDRWSWYYDLIEPGIVQGVVEDHAFSFCSYAGGERVRYTCEPDGAAWLIREASREPCTPEPHQAASPGGLELITLDLLDRVTLQGDSAPAAPFSDVSGFAVGGDGLIGVSSSTDDEPRSNKLIVVNAEGVVVHDRALNEVVGSMRVAPYGDDVWLVYSTGLGEHGAGAWLYRGGDDSLSALPEFAEGGLRTAAALPGGGFVGLAGADWVSAQDLVCFDDRGAVRWRRGLFSPEDVTVTSDGVIVALENIRDQLRFFSVDGEELRTVPLEGAIGEVNYPTGVHADANGGVILHDFNAGTPIHRIDADDKEWAKFAPRYPDGREFRLYGAVQRGPDGSLWTSDGHSVLGLDQDGVVCRVIGDQPGAAPLRRIRALAVGPDGRFYCINEYNGAVHVFERDGGAASVLRPGPDDFTIDAGLGSITAASDGGVFVLPTTHSIGPSRGYLVFGGNGERLGFDGFKLGEVREQWLCVPGTTDRWVLGYETVARINADGEIVRRIRKRANGNWLGTVQDGAVGADGSLAVVASPNEMGVRGPAELSVYTPDGEPVCAFPMDGQGIFARVAVCMPYVVTVDGDSLYLYDTRGGVPRRMTLPADIAADGRYWYIYSDPAELAVWVYASGTRELLRYRLPED